MRFDLFSSGKLYRALKAAGYPDLPSERTVRRWTEGNQPPASAVALVAELLGTEKNAAPEGAAETLLRLWQGDQPPAWSNIQVTKVIEEIRRDRAEAMTAMARRLGRMTAAELQELLSQLPDGSTPTASDP